MPIAAVPAYMGSNFEDASPGMRFGMYLKLWGLNRRSNALLWETFDVDHEVRGQQHQEREVKYENKVSALSVAKRLNKSDVKTMRELLARQQQVFDTVPTLNATIRLNAVAVAPFTTGLGNEHPLENGFSFLNPYGLPYLPGSGVKGVLRQAARELAGGEWGDSEGWSEEIRDKFPKSSEKDLVRLSMLDILFGRESDGGDTDHLRGTLTFWDVIPQIKGDSLAVEIMTPHQGHYYQEKATMGSVSPHESGQPTPISFLTVPPGSGFVFHVQCDLGRLKRLAPDLAENDRWKTLLRAAFTHAFDWLGFGAKTAVGYGQMRDKTNNVRHTSMAPAHSELAPPPDPEAVRLAEMQLFEKSLPSLANLPSQIDGVISIIRGKSDQATRKQCCQLLLDLARSNKKRFRSAVKDGKQWTKKLLELCGELEIGGP